MSKNLLVIILSITFSIILWISISLTHDYSTTINLPIRFSNIPEGYIPNAFSLNQVQVKVRGSGWNILSIMLTAVKYYNVDASKSSQGENILELKTFGAENTWLTSKLQILGIKPDTIFFSFEKVVVTKLKIIPELQLEFKDGYGLTSEIKVIPDSVIVSGPIKLINSLKEISTEPVHLKDLKEKTFKVVELKKIPRLTIEEPTVSVTIDVQKIVEYNFENVDVKVIDIPSDRNVILFPNKIIVQLRGGIDILGKFEKDKIVAFIPYRNIVLDSIGTVEPIINVPDNTSIVSIIPSRLTYVIKKFRK